LVVKNYVPDAGDVVWVDFTPQAGHEQAGRRPAIVLSPKLYNEKAGLAVLCPITSHAKGYPFEVAMPSALAVRGVILADRLKSLDWRQRQVQRFGKLPVSVLDAVRHRVAALLGLF
jgi:mRNA interferase MazF